MSSTTVTTPSPTQIAVDRRFAAPIALVWAAHTEPEHLTRWVTGPGGWALTSATADLRTGGAFTWVYENGDGATMTLEGDYLAVEPPHRIEHRENWGGGLPAPFVETTFTEDGDGTLVHITFTLPDQQTRDHVLASGGMTDGYEISHPRLDTLLASLA